MWLSGVLAYFLYNYGSMAIGAAYNSLFLIYVALFSASLFGLVLVLTSLAVQALPAHFSREGSCQDAVLAASCWLTVVLFRTFSSTPGWRTASA